MAAFNSELAAAANASLEQITKICDDCNETESSRCTAGGLHIPTRRSMQVLAKGIKRRQRMTSYCCNETPSNDANRVDATEIDNLVVKIRRTQSCSAIAIVVSSASSTTGDGTDDDLSIGIDCVNDHHRLQKSAKMLTIAAATKKRAMAAAPKLSNVATQTVGIEPNNYEVSLFEVLSETKQQRGKYENNLLSPHEILNQFVLQAIKSDSYEGAGNHRIDQVIVFKISRIF